MATMEQRRFGLRLGALSDPIAKQLKQAGLKAKSGDVSKWQKMADAITLLHVQGILHDSVASGARQKLVHMIGRTVG